MQEKRHDCVVEMRLCFFSRKAGDYKMLFIATRKCRSTAKEDYPKAQNEDSTIQLYDESEGEMESKHLNLSGQGLTSLDILETMDLTGVQSIDLSNNHLTSLEGADALEIAEVESLNLSLNNLKSLDGIEKFPNLQQLDIGGNYLMNLEILSSLRHPGMLKILYASGCDLRNLSGVEILSGLQTLSVGDNRLEGIKEIAVLKSLQNLFAENNRITSLEGIGGLENLIIAELNTNQIADVQGMEHNPSLSYMGLSYNQITDLKGIEKAENLKSVYLNNNEKLQSIAPLYELSCLENVRLDSTEVTLEDKWELAGFHDVVAEPGEWVQLNRVSWMFGIGEGLSVESDDTSLEIDSEQRMLLVKVRGNCPGVYHLRLRCGEIAQTVTVEVAGQPPVKGDATGDGNVDIADLRLVLRSVCRKAELTEVQTAAADVNGDGIVDIMDLRMILRAVCGKAELSDNQKLAADVEADNDVNIQDLRKILRYVCRKIDSFE